MKKLIVFVFCLFSFFTKSQIEDPTTWSFDIEELGDGSYNLLANVKIDKGWHIYSQYQNPGSFIISTSFYFKNIDGIKFIDSEAEKVDFLDGFKVFFSEDNPIEKFVPVQDEIARYFEDNASFSQEVEVQEDITQIDAIYEFMVCDDQQCLPPVMVDITFPLNKKNTSRDVECFNNYRRNIKGHNLLNGEIENGEFDYVPQSTINNNRITTKDYFEAIELSKKYNKPILVVFTGMACVNCRKLENQIWSDPEVNKLISKYILAQLYVDVRKEVPEHKIDECYADGRWKKSKIINTTGKQWSTLQTLTFGKNTQPLHIILKPSEDPNYDEELLKDENGNYLQPKSYRDANNVDVYKNWLKQGLNDFN